MWKTRGISFWFYSPTCKFADGPDSSFLYLNQRINCTDTHHSYPCFLLTEFVLLKQKLELHKTAFRMALFLQEESLSNAMPQAHPSHRNTIPLSSDRMQQGGKTSPPCSGMPQGHSNKIHLPYKTCTDLCSAKKAVQFLTHWPDPVSEAKSLSWPSPPGTAHP